MKSEQIREVLDLSYLFCGVVIPFFIPFHYLDSPERFISSN